MKPKLTYMPKFKSESEEADWWASSEGREYIKQRSAAARSNHVTIKGSALLANVNKKKSVQIAIRLPETDLARAHEIANRKGIGYQTFLKMLVHEGLARESRRG
jgi:predicted DNA binding CopG/RHH family protein